MKPRYNVSRQNRMRARRVETDGPVKRGGRASQQCPECGGWVANAARAHKRPEGGECRGVRPVELAELPPVNLPRQAKSSRPIPATPAPRLGVRLYGDCETCGGFVTGERRFCGTCLIARGTL